MDDFATGVLAVSLLIAAFFVGQVCGDSDIKHEMSKGRAIYIGDAEYRCEKKQAQRGEKGGE